MYHSDYSQRRAGLVPEPKKAIYGGYTGVSRVVDESIYHSDSSQRAGLVTESRQDSCVTSGVSDSSMFTTVTTTEEVVVNKTQLSEAMAAAIGSPEEHVAAGDVAPLLTWLREHVHPIGRALNAEQLVERVSGEPLSSAAFLAYLEAKLDRLNTVSESLDGSIAERP